MRNYNDDHWCRDDHHDDQSTAFGDDHDHDGMISLCGCMTLIILLNYLIPNHYKLLNEN